jgi:hypothetical protein
MERARFISHRGQRILFADYSELKDPDQIIATIDAVRALVAQEPGRSLLVLTYVEGATTAPAVTQAFKELAAHNKPYVLASALVGMTPMQRVIFEAVRIFAKRDIHSFDTLVAAKDWLVQQVYLRKSEEQVVG